MKVEKGCNFNLKTKWGCLSFMLKPPHFFLVYLLSKIRRIYTFAAVFKVYNELNIN